MESSCYDRPAENEVYISIKIKGSVNHADPLTCQNKSGKENKTDVCARESSGQRRPAKTINQNLREMTVSQP